MPDTLPTPAHWPSATARDLLAGTCDGYVVVSLWRSPGGIQEYEYTNCPTLNAAADLFTEYDSGEFSRATAVGIFPARNGMPCGPAFDPVYLSRLVRETRSAA